MIRFFDETEEKDFIKFKIVRGEGAYQLIEGVLSQLTQLNEIPYKVFSGFIRYDKRLRDYLYVYLGTFEEYLRDLVFQKIEYTGSNEIKKIGDIFTEYKPTSEYGFNFYINASFDFGSLIKIIKHFYSILDFDHIDKNFIHKLDDIRQLRNMVMHHAFVLVNPLSCDTLQQINYQYDKALSYINSLYDLLPIKWKEGFRNQFNKLKCDGNEFLTNFYLEI